MAIDDDRGQPPAARQQPFTLYAAGGRVSV